MHMSSFPHPMQIFAAAGENSDFGSLCRGPYFVNIELILAVLKNSGLPTSRFEGSKFLGACLEGSLTPPTWSLQIFTPFQRDPGPL